MKTIQLPKSGFKVELISEWTWGQMKDLQMSYLEMVKEVDIDGKAPKTFDFSKTLDSTLLAFKMAIVKIVNKDGSEIKFSSEWAKDLPSSDGELLEKEVNAIGLDVKKKQNV